MSRSNPISQVEIEFQILDILRQLEDHTEQYEQLTNNLSVAEAHYKGEWAAEYLKAQGTIKEREAIADFRLRDLYLQYKMAEGLQKAKREKLAALRTSLDALRTLAANVRFQVGP